MLLWVPKVVNYLKHKFFLKAGPNFIYIPKKLSSTSWLKASTACRSWKTRKAQVYQLERESSRYHDMDRGPHAVGFKVYAIFCLALIRSRFPCFQLRILLPFYSEHVFIATKQIYNKLSTICTKININVAKSIKIMHKIYN